MRSYTVSFSYRVVDELNAWGKGLTWTSDAIENPVARPVIILSLFSTTYIEALTYLL